METPANKSLTIFDQSRNALTSPKMALCSEIQIKDQIKLILMLSGTPPKDWLVKEEIDILVFYLKANLNNFHVVELSVAYQYYMKGLLPSFPFDKFARISALFFEQLMKAYNKDIRFDLMQQNVPKLPAPAPLTGDALMKTTCMDWFVKYKTKKLLHDFGGRKYAWLVKQGYLLFTPERTESIRRIARTIDDNKNVLASFLKKPVQPNDEQSISDNEATLLLKTYFDDLIKTDTDLSDILNDE